ncbi:MAG: hypothetical protein BRC26_03020 [Nanohaloarchaea archaeon QH_8_44_6]|nr:MAG: hypothetical protein BRC26_03020 [Nanohaloarchaea archaeon QH_8_44_6]
MLNGVDMKFKILNVMDCAVYQGKTYTYRVEVEIDAGTFMLEETTKIRPEDEGEILEMDLSGMGRIGEIVEDPEGIIENEGDVNEFEGKLKKIEKNSFAVDVEGHIFEIESVGIREEWPDLEKGDSVRFGASFFL